MIHVKRVKTPTAINSRLVNGWRQLAAKFFSRPYMARSQERHQFIEPGRVPKIRNPLFDMFRGKCAYCESYVSNEESSVVNFRPRSGAVNLDGAISSDHYWWLAYEWANLYLACPTCNNLKGARFPVTGKRAEAHSFEDLLNDEKPQLLDPCLDYPEDELIYIEGGSMASDTERGRTTIQVLSLNRSDLVAKRRGQLARLKESWRLVVKQLPKTRKIPEPLRLQLYEPRLEFLGLRRQFLQQWSLELVEKNLAYEEALREFLAFRTALKHQLFPTTEEVKKRVSVTKKTSSRAVRGTIHKSEREFQEYETRQESYTLGDDSRKEDYFVKTRFIERIEIRNFKVIQDLSLQLPLDSPDRGSWLLLLGENGTGKSSVLQAVALALMGDRARRRLKLDSASRFVRYGCKQGYVRVHLTGGSEPVELKFRSDADNFTTNTPEPKVLLLGYGATRLLPRRGSPIAKASAFSKVDNLFDPFTALSDATNWLYNLGDKHFDQVAQSLKELMLLDGRARLIKTTGERNVQFRMFGGQPVYLDDLSAGYQSVFALSTDIMSVLLKIWDAVRFAEGIVLIDEVDAHLHPRWKMQIVKRLRQTFPRVQFLVTSHEPLTLRGLNATEVAVMRRGERGRIFAVTEDLPNPSALRIDQLLTSEYFGLNSTISPELEARFDEYYELLAQRRPTQPQKARIAALKQELDGLSQMGSTPRERAMFEAIDAALAKKREEEAKADGRAKKKLKAATRKKVLRLWESLD